MLLKIKKCFKTSDIHCYIEKENTYQLSKISNQNNNKIYLYLDKIKYEEILSNIAEKSNISFYDYFYKIIKEKNNRKEKKNIYYKVLCDGQVCFISKKYFYTLK